MFKCLNVFFFFSNGINKNIILREIKAGGGTAERTENTRSYEDGVKAILYREDGHNVANFVSRSRPHDKILCTYTWLCMYDTRWAGDHLIVTLCILLRRQFTNPYAERRNSRLTVTLICSRSLAKKRKKKRSEKRAGSSKVSKHGSQNVKGEAAGKSTPSSLFTNRTLNIFHHLQLLVQTFFGNSSETAALIEQKYF